MSQQIVITGKDKIYAIWMFVKLRYIQWSFYYTKWTIEEIGYIAYLAGLYFLSSFIGGGSMVKEYGGNYTAFLLLGDLINGFFWHLEEMPYSRLHEAYWGSWQMYLLSPLGVWPYLLGSVIWVIIHWTAFYLLPFLMVLYFVFGVNISFAADPLALLTVFAFSVISMVGFAFISCSTFFLLNAKGYQNPIRFFTFYIIGLITGVFFPIAILPSWVQFIGILFPHFYAFRSLRLILLTNANINDPIVVNDIFTLALFSVILTILGVVLFELGLRKAKKNGDLTRWV